MNVSLTAELERWVQSKVEAGLYQSASEVVRDALRLLVERDRLQLARVEELRRDLQLGVDELESGQGVPFDQALVDQIKVRGRSRVARS